MRQSDLAARARAHRQAHRHGREGQAQVSNSENGLWCNRYKKGLFLEQCSRVVVVVVVESGPGTTGLKVTQ